MIKLDFKDKKILYELDLDSRQSLSKIGKKVRLPKNVVAYRMNRLKELGVIKNFYTVIDASKLGYISLRFYLVFQHTTSEKEKEIIDYFVNNKFTYWIGSIEGRFDLIVIMWVKDINDFYLFWEETLRKYGNYFQDQLFTVYIQLLHYRYSYLLDEKINRTKFEITGGGKKVNIDELDFKVLKLIASNARMPVTEIAQKLNATAMIVNYRVKKLINLKVIQGFRTNIDISKLNYQHFKVDIYLEDYKKIDLLIGYLKYNANLIYIDKSVGISDLELEFHFQTLENLQKTMNDLMNKFPNTIKNYKYFLIPTVHKLHYMPEE